MRNDPEMSPLADAQLVGYLPRLGVAHRVVDIGLPASQVVEGADRGLGLGDHRLHRRDRGVAPEQGHEPGEPRRRHPVLG